MVYTLDMTFEFQIITFLIQKLAECLAHSGYSINEFNCPKFPLDWFSSPKASLKLETVITQSQGFEVIAFPSLKSMRRSSFLEPQPPALDNIQGILLGPEAWFQILRFLSPLIPGTDNRSYLFLRSTPCLPVSLPLFTVFPWSGISPPPCLGFCLAVVSDSWTLPEPSADVIPASGSSLCSPDQLGVLISAY